NVRTLGTIAMICAPALFVEGLITTVNGPSNVTIGIASFVFMFGWICTNLAMQQMQATGTGLWGKVVLWIQLDGVVVVMLFGLIEGTDLLGVDNVIISISEMWCQLRMVYIVGVRIMPLRANRWTRWQRFVPLVSAGWLTAALFIP